MLILKILRNAFFSALMTLIFFSWVHAGEDILIAQKVEFENPIWCGNKILVYEIEETGVFWHNIEKGEKEFIANEYASSIGCTPDGEWLVYMDKDSVRGEDGSQERYGIIDLWRYEFRTKRKQKFTVADDQVSSFHENSISKEGRIFLPIQPKTRIEMPEPEWEIVWSQFSKLGNPFWLSDSKTVLAESHIKQNIKPDLVLETINPERKTAVISPELIARQILMVDALDRVYIEVWNGRFSGAKNSILRCVVDVENGTISCEPFFERAKNISGFELFPDMESAAFVEREGDCVLKTRFKEEAECITGTYPEVSGNFNISPDGKWLAFAVYKKYGDRRKLDLYLKMLE